MATRPRGPIDVPEKASRHHYAPPLAPEDHRRQNQGHAGRRRPRGAVGIGFAMGVACAIGTAVVAASISETRTAKKATCLIAQIWRGPDYSTENAAVSSARCSNQNNSTIQPVPAHSAALSIRYS